MRKNYPGIFVDTNVVVYLYDPRDKSKQQRAWDVLDELVVARGGILSSQVLAEFCSVCIGKLRAYITADDLVANLENWMQLFTILDLTPAVVLEAARAVCAYSLSYWDAQIWATAKLNHVPVVLSEDFADGYILEGVSFVNPFKPSFDPTCLHGISE